MQNTYMTSGKTQNRFVICILDVLACIRYSYIIRLHTLFILKIPHVHEFGNLGRCHNFNQIGGVCLFLSLAVFVTLSQRFFFFERVNWIYFIVCMCLSMNSPGLNFALAVLLCFQRMKATLYVNTADSNGSSNSFYVWWVSFYATQVYST